MWFLLIAKIRVAVYCQDTITGSIIGKLFDFSIESLVTDTYLHVVGLVLQRK